MGIAKLGIAVRNLGGSDLNWLLIRDANRAAANGLDVTMFYQELVPSCLPTNFAVMPLVEAWSYDGPVVATTLATAKKLASFPGSGRRLFYVWDLEWLRMPSRQFHVLSDVYSEPALELVARCDEHAKLLGQLWSRKVNHVVPGASINGLMECIRCPSN